MWLNYQYLFISSLITVYDFIICCSAKFIAFWVTDFHACLYLF